jgi:hypothetical protein
VKLLFLASTLLLTSCAGMRYLTPTEQIWRHAYCEGGLVTPGDKERVKRWAERHGIECQ